MVLCDEVVGEQDDGLGDFLDVDFGPHDGLDAELARVSAAADESLLTRCRVGGEPVQFGDGAFKRA